MISDILRVNLKDSPQVKIIFVLGGFLSQLIFWLALKKCCLTAPNKCLNVSQFFQILNQSLKETLEHLPILTNSQSIAQRNARTPLNSDKFSRFDASGKDRLVIHELSRLDQVKDQTTN